jgi:hypothetical protein
MGLHTAYHKISLKCKICTTSIDSNWIKLMSLSRIQMMNRIAVADTNSKMCHMASYKKKFTTHCLRLLLYTVTAVKHKMKLTRFYRMK